MIIGPCTVVTGGPTPAVLEGAGVRVVGAHIAQVGPIGNLASTFPDDTLWPARHRVLMPGFVNTHAHLARHLARGLGLRHPREWDRFDRALTPDDVRWGVSAALVEGLRHGVTTVCDFHRTASWRDGSLAHVLEAARNVGVRVAACYGASESDAADERRGAVESCRALAGEIHQRREGRLRALAGVRAHTLSAVEPLLQETLDTAGDHLSVHMDLALDTTPAERWRARDHWSDSALPSLWAHAEAAPRGLVAAAHERGDALCAVGHGSSAAVARDVDVTWGSDSGLNALPFPDTAPGWAAGARAETFYRSAFVNGPRWATRHFDTELGEVAAGAPADLILVEYRPATEMSARTLLEHLSCGLLRAPVASVMVSGEILVDNGVVVSVDEREIAARARRCAKTVWGRLE